jgi:hypothetical protein
MQSIGRHERLERYMVAQVDALAEAEFTDRPAMLNWLVVFGMGAHRSKDGDAAWREFAGKFLSDGGAIPKWPTD